MARGLWMFVFVVGCGGGETSDEDLDPDAGADSDSDTDTDTDTDTGSESDSDTGSGTETGEEELCDRLCAHDLECDPKDDHASCLQGCACGEAIWRADFYEAAIECSIASECVEGRGGACFASTAEDFKASESGADLAAACLSRQETCPDLETICAADWAFFIEPAIAGLRPCFEAPECADVVTCIAAGMAPFCR